MLLQFSMSSVLRTSDFDRHSRLLPSAVLELFQDAAGEHADRIGIGFRALEQRGLLWVVARTRYIVDRPAQMYQPVAVTTWPLEPHGYICRREYQITGQDGAVLIRGSSDWVILDRATRAPVLARELYPAGAAYRAEPALEERPGRLHEPAGEPSRFDMTPHYTDVDFNGHVNNTRYADYVLDALRPEQRAVGHFRIDYLHEVAEGQPLTLLTVQDEARAVCRGLGAEGQALFVCEVQWK